MRNENEYEDEDDMTPEEAFQLVPVNGNKYLHIYFFYASSTSFPIINMYK